MSKHVYNHDDFVSVYVCDHDDLMSEHVCNHDNFMNEHVYIARCHIDLNLMRDI